MRRFAQVWAGQPIYRFDDVSEGTPRFSKMQNGSTCKYHVAHEMLKSEVGIYKTGDDRHIDPRSFSRDASIQDAVNKSVACTSCLFTFFH
jgi:hypothetical protein